MGYSCTAVFVQGPGRALFVGPIKDNTPHAHHALQLCVSLDASLELRANSKEPWRSYQAALVAANAPHQLRHEVGKLALVYVEPTSAAGRGLAHIAPHGIFAVPREPFAEVVKTLVAGPPSPAAMDALLTAATAQAPAQRPVDARIDKAVAALATLDMPSTEGLARSVALSASRFRHLFRQQMGVSVRAYKLWSRLQQAVLMTALGIPLTDVAHAAGFADSAHFARTCRRMFGFSPKQVQQLVARGL